MPGIEVISVPFIPFDRDITFTTVRCDEYKGNIFSRCCCSSGVEICIAQRRRDGCAFSLGSIGDGVKGLEKVSGGVSERTGDSP